MSLIGNIIASAFSGNPAIINFDMFVAVFAMLSLIFFIATTVLNHDLPPLWTIILDSLNTLFFFLAAVITAAILGAHSCSDNSYTLHNSICNGSADRESRCREAQAATAFLFFGFFTFLATTALSFMNRGGGSLGSIASRPSAMSQV
jgi:uncharacterized metal-binding protein